MKKHLVLLFSAFICTAQAQSNVIQVTRTLQWGEKPQTIVSPSGEQLESWAFEGCSHSDAAPVLPLYNERFALNGPAELSTEFTATEWEPIALSASVSNSVIVGDLQPTIELEQERMRFFARVNLFPLRRTASGGYERLRSFTLSIRTNPLPTPAPLMVGDRNALNSKLSNGEIYKFGVQQTSLYKLTYEFLKNKFRYWAMAAICCRKKIANQDQRI